MITTTGMAGMSATLVVMQFCANREHSTKLVAREDQDRGVDLVEVHCTTVKQFVRTRPLRFDFYHTFQEAFGWCVCLLSLLTECGRKMTVFYSQVDERTPPSL